MSDSTHAAKKPQTTPAGTPIFSDRGVLDHRRHAAGHGDQARHGQVRRRAPHIPAVGRSNLAPRALWARDGDGFKFCGKPSLNIEMPDAQLAFFRDGIEAAVKEAAVKNKEAWFGAVKPLPADEAVRASFNSRVREDEAGKYIPTLKVNVGLGVDASTRRSACSPRGASPAAR